MKTSEIIAKLAELGHFVTGIPVYKATDVVIAKDITAPVTKNLFGEDVLLLVDESNPKSTTQVRFAHGADKTKKSFDLVKFVADRAAKGTTKDGNAWSIAVGKAAVFAV